MFYIAFTKLFLKYDAVLYYFLLVCFSLSKHHVSILLLIELAIVINELLKLNKVICTYPLALVYVTATRRA